MRLIQRLYGKCFCVWLLVLGVAMPLAAAVHDVTPASNLQAVINGAVAGDTIRFGPGTYRTTCINVFKRLNLIAQQPHTAVLQGTAQAPRRANDGAASAPACALNLARRTTDGTRIEGLQFQYFGIAVYIKGVGNLQIINNRFVSNYGDGIAMHDTADVEVRGNAFLDPYLPEDQPGSVEPYWVDPVGVTDAQMDYGIAIYGSLRPRVHHNYFSGIFNQALSFKIANRDAYAGYNTFEGFNLTALFFGQEPSTPETFPEFGASGLEGGRMVAEGNVFRVVRGIHPGTQTYADYRGRSPLRIRHVDGNVIVRNNVIESAVNGIVLECAGTACPRGSVSVTNNLVVGRVITTDNVVHDIGGCGIDVQAGTTATVNIFQNTIGYQRFGLCAEGGSIDIANTEFVSTRERDVRATADVIDYNNQFAAAGPVLGSHSTAVNPQFVGPVDLRIKNAALTMTPNRSFTLPFHIPSTAPGAFSGRHGTYKGAFLPLGIRVFEDGFGN